jgi:phenylacetate-CoA ligase
VHPVRLPFLWIYGRRDATISVMGANIYPEDIETIIYKDGPLTGRLHSFCLSVVTDSSATPRPCVALELNSGLTNDAHWSERLAAQFQAGLADLNLDYRAALSEFPAAMVPMVELYARGEGPFKADAGRIKQRRIAQITPGSAPVGHSS